MFRKHQEETNDYAKKPMVVGNVLSMSVCVLTKTQRAAAKENSKEKSESKNENEDKKNSGDSKNNDSVDEDDNNIVEVLAAEYRASARRKATKDKPRLRIGQIIKLY